MTTPETMEDIKNKLARSFNPKHSGATNDFLNEVEDAIALAVQKREEELREKIEKIIQDERFSGAPYVLNQVLDLLTKDS